MHGGDTGPSPANSNCGYGSDPSWNWATNSAPYLVEACIGGFAKGPDPSIDPVGPELVKLYSRRLLGTDPDSFTEDEIVNAIADGSGDPDWMTAKLLGAARTGSGYYGLDITDPLAGSDVLLDGVAASGNIDNDPNFDLVLTGIDRVSGIGDYWRLAYASRCTGGTSCGYYSAVKAVPSDGWRLGFAGVALYDWDNDGRAEIVLRAIDMPEPGADYWRLQRVRNCNPAMSTCETLPAAKQVPIGREQASGGGIAIGQLTGGPLPEILLTAEDRASGSNIWVYRVLIDCDINLNCASDSGPQSIAYFSNSLAGGGVAIGDLNGDGVKEVFVSAVDQSSSEMDRWVYAIGSACSNLGCTFSPVRQISAFPYKFHYQSSPDGMIGGTPDLGGGGVTIGRILPTGNEQVLISSIAVHPQQMDFWQYRVARECNPLTGDCVWGAARSQKSSGWQLLGGAPALTASCAQCLRDILYFAASDSNDAGQDYWRYNGLNLSLTSNKERFLFELGAEPNDSRLEASHLGRGPISIVETTKFTSANDPLGEGGYQNYKYIITHDDVDYYRFDLTDSRTAYIFVPFSHQRGDLDIQLQDSVGNVVASSTGVSDSETIYTTLSAGTYYLKVYGYAGATGRYGFYVHTW